MKNIEIVQEITKDDNEKQIHNMKNYIKEDPEIKRDRKLCRWIVFSSAAMLLFTNLIFLCFHNNDSLVKKIVPFAVLLVQHICFVMILHKAANYTYQELNKKYSTYEMFVFVVTNSAIIRKAKISRDRKRLKLYRKYYEEVVDSSIFEVLGMGNNVYKIDLDKKIIFVKK